MKPPFIYGKLVSGADFTDREQETARLVTNFLAGTNTIILSPRRWGKSSLVNRASNMAIGQDSRLRIIHMDLFNIRSEAGFYKALSEKVISAVSGRVEQVAENVKEFMRRWVPRISFSPDAQQEISFGLDWNEVKKEPAEILEMAEAIAIRKDLHIVVCIDEFQNIGFYDDPVAFQKTLRAAWQKQSRVSYCLYGSKRHMLMDVFASPSMPFYKFGDLIFLEKISRVHWGPFIQNRFKTTKKSITRAQAERIATTVDLHPYYVQQLAQICWLRTEKKVEDATIDEATEHLVLQLSMLFQGITEGLTTSQVNFLMALTDGVERLSAAETLREYGLGSSAHIAVIKKALMQKEIIDDQGGVIDFLDPVYRLWLRRYYFSRRTE